MLGDRPFRFEAAWLIHKDFHKWLHKEWRYEGDLTRALKDLVIKMKAWNKATFGNIFERKKNNELRLGGVHRALALRGSEHLLLLERELREGRRTILL